jgi:formate hydrogenlyase subunit 3/multisubunit Na+/H+ antiporter MnhD subunit
VAVIASVLTMVVLVRAAYGVFWAGPRSAAPAAAEAREVPVLMWAPMAILAAACLWLGVHPQTPYALLHRAAGVLATMGR